MASKPGVKHLSILPSRDPGRMSPALITIRSDAVPMHFIRCHVSLSEPLVTALAYRSTLNRLANTIGRNLAKRGLELPNLQFSTVKSCNSRRQECKTFGQMSLQAHAFSMPLSVRLGGASAAQGSRPGYAGSIRGPGKGGTEARAPAAACSQHEVRIQKQPMLAAISHHRAAGSMPSFGGAEATDADPRAGWK